jgi:Subtilase family
MWQPLKRFFIFSLVAAAVVFPGREIGAGESTGKAPGLNSLGVPPSEAKIHPYLAEQMLAAGPDTRLPVYFVIGDRLGYDDFFPWVLSMKIDDRRTTVVKILRTHADRTQADLLALLRAAERAERATIISANWLGNFVRCEATPNVIREAAALASVSEVWFDYVPPLEAVLDSAPTGPAAVLPGNGPLNVGADLVWGLGFTGQGVVVMNADSGIHGTHGDLAGRLWVNPGEIPGNLVDDDLNGKVDDVNGWNFGANNAVILNTGDGHGTNTAGCLVADGTCTGTIYGMAPGAKVMTGRLSGESSQWDAVQYGIAQGAHTQTSSHSYKANFNPPPNYKMHRDVGETSLAAGLIRTNSTSNDGSSCNSTTSFVRKPFNISAPGCLPAPYLDPNQTLVGKKGGVIGVAAYQVATGSLATYSPCGPFAWNLPDLLAVNPAYNVANWDAVNDNDYPWQGASLLGCLKPDVAAPTGTTTTSGGSCATSTFSGTSNATPCANGVMMLWKGANPSLTPEDVAMIVHQTAEDAGVTPGKENNWGAGRIKALAGLKRALCVHRVNGDPGWTVPHQVGTVIEFALDGSAGQPAYMAVAAQRMSVPYGPVVLGIGPIESLFVYFAGATDASGDASFSYLIPPSIAGFTIYTQGAIDDTLGPTGELLLSNVIGVTFTL